MKTTDIITYSIDRLPKGYVFTYKDFMSEVQSKEAVIKALNRMAKSGKIAKLSKGKFYKSEKTPFGNLQPNQYQVVKDLLEKNGKTIGYLTGYSIYNQLGFTTQVSNKIQIGKNDFSPPLKRGRFIVSFVKQKNTITKENIPLLQILDSIRFIKKIPAATVESACKRLLIISKDLSQDSINTMIKLSLKYPPSTRALLGAILQSLGYKGVTKLKESLNPITTYTIPGANRVLNNTSNWNIE